MTGENVSGGSPEVAERRRWFEPLARKLPRHHLVRDVALAASLLVLVGLLAVGVAKLRAVQPFQAIKPPSATSRPVPWTAAPMVLFPETAEALDPAEVAPKLMRTVTSGEPLLLPLAITPDYQAQVIADSNGYVVDYMSSSRRATVELSTGQTALAPASAGSRKGVVFRNSQATYQIEDAAATAPRGLNWMESGQPYWLASDGLNETEFWQVANSLQLLQPPSAARPCRASDLRAVAGGENGASGQIFNGIVFSNKSATLCQLDGTPTLSLRTTTGQVLPIPQTNSLMPWATSAPAAALVRPNSADPQLHSSVEGQVTVGFSVWDCPANPPLASLTIVLPAGRGILTVPAGDLGYSWGGECEGNHIARLVVGPFTAMEPQPVYVENSALSITLKVPATVQAGTRLHYQVILTNASGAPFHFHECPSYTEDASRPGSKLLANYQLNCGGVGWLLPDGSVTFEMQFDTPAGAALGPGYLRWSMRSPYGNNEAQVPLTIQ